MSAEIYFEYPTGESFFATIRKESTHHIWWPAGEVFEVKGTGGRTLADDYAITITDNTDGTYTGDFDANITDLGAYVIDLHLSADNEVCSSGLIFWDGAREGLDRMISKVYTDGVTLEWVDLEIMRNET